jgi:hypothetical protein
MVAVASSDADHVTVRGVRDGVADGDPSDAEGVGSDPVSEADSLTDSVRVTVGVGGGVMVHESDSDRLRDPDRVREAVGVSGSESEPVPVSVRPDIDAEPPDGVITAEKDAEALSSVAVKLSDRDALTDTSNDVDADREPPVGEVDGDADSDSEADREGVNVDENVGPGDSVYERLRLFVSDTETDGPADGVNVGEGVVVPVGGGVTDAVGVGGSVSVSVDVGTGLLVVVIVALDAVIDPVPPEADAVCVALPENEVLGVKRDAVTDTDAESVTESDGVDVGPGDTVDEPERVADELRVTVTPDADPDTVAFVNVHVVDLESVGIGETVGGVETVRVLLDERDADFVKALPDSVTDAVTVTADGESVVVFVGSGSPVAERLLVKADPDIDAVGAVPVADAELDAVGSNDEENDHDRVTDHVAVGGESVTVADCVTVDVLPGLAATKCAIATNNKATRSGLNQGGVGKRRVSAMLRSNRPPQR